MTEQPFLDGLPTTTKSLTSGGWIDFVKDKEKINAVENTGFYSYQAQLE